MEGLDRHLELAENRTALVSASGQMSSRDAGKHVHRKDAANGSDERVHPLTQSKANFSQNHLVSPVKPVWICAICPLSMVLILTYPS